MDGKNRLKHVERLTEINRLGNVASLWLYCANILAMHGPVSVKFKIAVIVFTVGLYGANFNSFQTRYTHLTSPRQRYVFVCGSFPVRTSA